MTLFTSIHKVFNFNLVNGWEDEMGGDKKHWDEEEEEERGSKYGD